MNSKLSLPVQADQAGSVSRDADASTADIATDLTWVDMLKGIAIIAVFFDNLLFYWMRHMDYSAVPGIVRTLVDLTKTAVGPFVQVFFILSGFGLTLAYFNQRRKVWSWRKWTWRRLTKILIPYWIFVILTFLMGIIGMAAYQMGDVVYGTVKLQFTWSAFLAYLTLTRNFFQQTWYISVPLWYMPVLIGLYIVFPLLVKFLEKWGARWLLALSLVVTFGSLAIAYAAKWATGAHFSDLFTFWVFQFVLGMLLAKVRVEQPERLRRLLGIPALLTGLVLIGISFVIKNYVPMGGVFNDAVTSLGYFLFLLNVVWAARKFAPVVGRVLSDLSEKSYFMYLIHWPLMVYLIAPAFGARVNPFIALALIVVYIPVTYFVCSLLARPIGRLTYWLNTLPAREEPSAARVHG